ncbi:MAG: response regulator [Phycisphaerae bacterium]|nr:response regulator [Gemmatimonadaceae bacterium]
MKNPGKCATILVVEDNEDNRIIYGTMLRAHGFVVNEATGGESALAAAREAPPDLVLMDIGLPEMDGVEATRHLKSDPKTSSIPVLALTAHALMSERQRAMQAGVDGYLVKPIGVAALIREVERALLHAAERLPHDTDPLQAN